MNISYSINLSEGISACAEARNVAKGRRMQGSAKENADLGRGFVYGGHVRSHESTNGKPLRRLPLATHSRIAWQHPRKSQNLKVSINWTAAKAAVQFIKQQYIRSYLLDHSQKVLPLLLLDRLLRMRLQGLP